MAPESLVAMDPEYAGQYRELYQRHWWWRAREELLVRELRRLAPAGGWRRILDIGCGDGLFFPRLEELGREVQGVEPDRSMIAPASPNRGRIHAGPLDTFQPGHQFDLILLLDVVEHVPDPAPFLRRALDLLAPGGTVVTTVPAFRLLWTGHDVVNHHQARYTRSSFAALARSAGLQVTQSRYFFQSLFFVKLGVRLYEAIARPVPGPPRVPPQWINRLAYFNARLDHAVLWRLRMPFGSSLFVAGKAMKRG